MNDTRTRALVIGRRRKGRRNGAVVKEVRDGLQKAGWKVDARLVVRKRDLRKHARRAAKAGWSVVVAVGGDGAVVEVATSVAGTDTALAIVPTGTGNLLAGNLGIPRGSDAGVRTVLGGIRRRIDFGRVTVGDREHGFAVACGVGFDADVMDKTAKSQKLRWGKLAYLSTALARSGRLRNVSHRITLDGVSTTMDAAQVFVANLGRMLPLVEPREPIRGDDGVLDIVAIRASGPLPGLLAGWEALTQSDHGKSSGGHAFRATAKEVTIEPEHTRLVEADGSVIGQTPATISIRPGALTVMVPKP